MPAFVKGPDGEKAWKKAKGIVEKEYGDIEKSDPDKFFALVTTVYKSVCKSPDFNCGEATEGAVSMGSLIERLEQKGAEAMNKVKDRLRDKPLGEGAQPKLNKYDPGSPLGWTVYLLEKYNLEDAADEVRRVSRSVSKAWQEREK